MLLYFSYMSIQQLRGGSKMHFCFVFSGIVNGNVRFYLNFFFISIESNYIRFVLLVFFLASYSTVLCKEGSQHSVCFQRSSIMFNVVRINRKLTDYSVRNFFSNLCTYYKLHYFCFVYTSELAMFFASRDVQTHVLLV